MGDREQRIGENEALWRQINELAPPEPGVMNPVFCECGRAGCSDQMLMTAEEYESVRSESTTFAVVPGHELGDVESVVKTNDRFLVVDKNGDAAVIAERTDPRE
jgi:hypothetical protein